MSLRTGYLTENGRRDWICQRGEECRATPTRAATAVTAEEGAAKDDGVGSGGVKVRLFDDMVVGRCDLRNVGQCFTANHGCAMEGWI